MKRVEILNIDITQVAVDAIVNAANQTLVVAGFGSHLFVGTRRFSSSNQF